MSPRNGPSGEMDETPRFPRDPLQLDDGTVDRLLDGLPVDDAPPSYRGVAELLHTIKAAPMTGPERAPRPPRYASPPRMSVQYSTSSRPRPRSHRRFRRASAALVGSATLFVGLGAAGALPGAAQVVASNVLGTVGVNAPNPDEPVNVDSKPAVNSDGPSGATIVNPGSDSGSNSGTDNGTTISGIASDDSTTGVDKGAAVSAAASDGRSDAGQSGAPASPQTGSSDPADNGNANGNNGNGNSSSGNNGNHNGADNGNRAGNGNVNSGNAGVGQANRP